MGKIGVYTSGLWRKRADIAALTGLTPSRRYWSARGLVAIAGWGHKPTARHARRLARRHGLPYLAIEDGFFRSAAPGDAEPSASYVCDQTGIYYAADGPSDLERLVLARRETPEQAQRDAQPAIDAMMRLGLSKYSAFDTEIEAALTPTRAAGGDVLVVDQTAGDASVSGAGATAESFARMLAAAASENPAARLVVKAHPETTLGRRSGHYDMTRISAAATAAPALGAAIAENRLTLLTARVRPRDLLRRMKRVYVVSSLLGLEALVAGTPVTCFGRAFYSGWGLTDDRAPPTGRRAPASLHCLVAAAFVDYSAYFDPETRRRCSLADAIAALDARQSHPTSHVGHVDRSTSKT